MLGQLGELILSNSGLSEQYAQTTSVFDDARRTFKNYMFNNEIDFLLTPTLPEYPHPYRSNLNLTAAEMGEIVALRSNPDAMVQQFIESASRIYPELNVHNMTGLPAITFNAGMWRGQGNQKRPTGLSLVGRDHTDSTLIGIASQFHVPVKR
jgi:Asp-tRNA(Asn)/Glu-tRNA(Gln) amidotransferase A subunit family amidase